MEETLASRTMAEIDLIKNLEKISSEITYRILKIQGLFSMKITKKNQKKLFSKGSVAQPLHPIEIELEKKVIEFTYIFTNFKLYKAPLKKQR